jgi:hypothetical protein
MNMPSNEMVAAQADDRAGDNMSKSNSSFAAKPIARHLWRDGEPAQA